MAVTLTDFARIRNSLGVGGAAVDLSELSRLVETVALSDRLMVIEPVGSRYDAEWCRERGQVFDLGRRHIYESFFHQLLQEPPWEVASEIAQEADRRRQERSDDCVLPELRSLRSLAEGAALRESGLGDDEALDVLERVRVMVMLAAKTRSVYDPASVEAGLAGLLIPFDVSPANLGEYRQYESTLREYLRGASVRSLTIRMPLLLGVVLRECRAGCPDDVMSLTLQLRETPELVRMRFALGEYAVALYSLDEKRMAKCARKVREEVKAARERLVSTETSAVTYVLKPLRWEVGWSVEFERSLGSLLGEAGVVRVGPVKLSEKLLQDLAPAWERVIAA